MEAHAFELKLLPTPVTRLVDTVVARLAHRVEDKRIVLTTDIPSDLPAVQADEGRIGQVLLNLVGNALRYAHTGGAVSITPIAMVTRCVWLWRIPGSALRPSISRTFSSGSTEVDSRSPRWWRQRHWADHRPAHNLSRTVARSGCQFRSGRGALSASRCRRLRPFRTPIVSATSRWVALAFFNESLHVLYGSVNRAPYTVRSGSWSDR